MTKPNLGKKHTCKACETRFFDLNKNPAVCPKCGEEIKIAKPKSKRPMAPAPESGTTDAPGTKAENNPEKETADDAVKDDDLELDTLDDADDVIDLDDDEDDDDLMEDTSEIGEDNDDMSEVLEHVDDGIDDK